MKSQVFISRPNLEHNIRTIRNYIHPRTKIMSVVKAGAYGHGLDQVAPILDPLTDYFAVYHFESALELQQYTDKSILVLGSAGSHELMQAIGTNIMISVFSIPSLQEIISVAKNNQTTFTIHLSTNTGLNREGLDKEEFEEGISLILENQDCIRLQGVYSHFANIEDTSDPSYAQMQIKRFEWFKKYSKQHLNEDVEFHISSTAGTMVYEKDLGISDIVRPGLGLYGMYPSRYLELEYKPKGFELKPVLEWRTTIRKVGTIQAGESVSYGCTWTATRETKFATIPIGYSDGLPRKFSNIGYVLIQGQKCPILGREAMNLHVVDVSHLDSPAIGQEVVIIGRQRDQSISAESLADLFGTINYEVTTAINRSLERKIKLN